MSRGGPMEVIPMGDRALLARFETEREASDWAEAVRIADGPGIVDVVPAFRSVAVHADPERIDLESLEPWLRGLAVTESSAARQRSFRVPVRYDGTDLEEVARRLGLEVEGVIERHAGPSYTVQAIGFQAGFPYLGDLPSALVGLPRRDRPRTRVRAGSVAIVGDQSCIYPRESPGGWHLLGRTPLTIAEPAVGFFPIRVGDVVRFVPINADDFAKHQGARLATEKWGAGASPMVG